MLQSKSINTRKAYTTESRIVVQQNGCAPRVRSTEGIVRQRRKAVSKRQAPIEVESTVIDQQDVCAALLASTSNGQGHGSN